MQSSSFKLGSTRGTWRYWRRWARAVVLLAVGGQKNSQDCSSVPYRFVVCSTHKSRGFKAHGLCLRASIRLLSAERVGLVAVVRLRFQG